MPMTEGAARPTIDWRDWVAFLGYALATAVVVSVLLASFVLVISMQAEDPRPGAEAGTTTALPAAAPAAAPAIVAPATPAAPARSVGTVVEKALPEITAETLRAEQPIAPAQPAVVPATQAADTGPSVANPPAVADQRPAEAMAAPRIEITSESLRAEQPMGTALPAAAQSAPPAVTDIVAETAAPAAVAHPAIPAAASEAAPATGEVAR